MDNTTSSVRQLSGNDRNSMRAIYHDYLRTGNLCPILLWSDFNSKFAQTAQ